MNRQEGANKTILPYSNLVLYNLVLYHLLLGNFVRGSLLLNGHKIPSRDD